MSIIIISLALFFILLFLGVPIVVSIGVSCIAIWVQMPQIITNPTYMFQAMTTSLDSCLYFLDRSWQKEESLISCLTFLPTLQESPKLDCRSR